MRHREHLRSSHHKHGLPQRPALKLLGDRHGGEFNLADKHDRAIVGGVGV